MENPTNATNNRKRYVKGLSFVTIANIVSFLVGVASSLLVPKILSTAAYADYSAFNLYSAYVGFFHLGFVDGIYLIYSGINYQDIDKPKFRTFFWFFFVLEAIFGVLAAIFSVLFIHDATTLIILILVILTMFATNITNYYGIIAQLTTDFKNFSVKTLIRVFIKGASLVLFLVLFKLDLATDYLAWIYIITSVILADFIVDVCYMFTFKEVTFGPCKPLKECWGDIWTIFKCGFPLLIGNICIIILYSLNKQIVQIGYDDATFASYSFAYTILSIVTTITGGIATIIFPILRQLDEAKIRSKYDSVLRTMMYFGLALCSVYFLGIWGINWLLPSYNSSVPTLAIVLPISVMYSLIMVLIHSYYKALGINNAFVVISLAFLALAFGVEIGVQYAFHSPDALSYAAVVIFLSWMLFLMAYLHKKKGLPFYRNALVFTLGLGAYYGTVVLNLHWYRGFLFYLALAGSLFLLDREFFAKKKIK